MVTVSTLLEVGGFVALVVFAGLAFGVFAACAVAAAVVMVVGHKLGEQ